MGNTTVMLRGSTNDKYVVHSTRVNQRKEFSEHYRAMAQADILFILNLEKKRIPGYIGPGVYAEIAFALGMNQAFKKHIEVYYLNPIFKNILPYSDELELWQKLGWIQLFNKKSCLEDKMRLVLSN